VLSSCHDHVASYRSCFVCPFHPPHCSVPVSEWWSAVVGVDSRLGEQVYHAGSDPGSPYTGCVGGGWEEDDASEQDDEPPIPCEEGTPPLLPDNFLFMPNG
jgi:hypothetical protein